MTMRLRTPSREDEAFDGLTAEEVRAIRASAAKNVTPGLEGLAKLLEPKRAEKAEMRTTNKRGRR